jgi:hypothetical protein
MYNNFKNSSRTNSLQEQEGETSFFADLFDFKVLDYATVIKDAPSSPPRRLTEMQPLSHENEAIVTDVDQSNTFEPCSVDQLKRDYEGMTPKKQSPSSEKTFSAVTKSLQTEKSPKSWSRLI